MDEFIHINKQKNGTNSPMKNFLKLYPKDEYACMAMNSIPFGTNTFINKADDPSEYTIDKVWRKNISLSKESIWQIQAILQCCTCLVHRCSLLLESRSRSLSHKTIYPEKDHRFLIPSTLQASTQRTFCTWRKWHDQIPQFTHEG